MNHGPHGTYVRFRRQHAGNRQPVKSLRQSSEAITLGLQKADSGCPAGAGLELEAGLEAEDHVPPRDSGAEQSISPGGNCGLHTRELHMRDFLPGGPSSHSPRLLSSPPAAPPSGWLSAWPVQTPGRESDWLRDLGRIPLPLCGLSELSPAGTFPLRALAPSATRF